MKPFLTKDGYYRIELKISPGVAKKFAIHRLVYQTFVGPLDDRLVIDHIDGNRINNHYSNLRQCPQKENIQNAIRLGNFGKNNSKPIAVRDIHNGNIYHFEMIKDLIEFIGVPISNGSSKKLYNHSQFKNNYEVLE